jgi:hypothetical protein
VDRRARADLHTYCVRVGARGWLECGNRSPHALRLVDVRAHLHLRHGMVSRAAARCSRARAVARRSRAPTWYVSTREPPSSEGERKPSAIAESAAYTAVKASGAVGEVMRGRHGSLTPEKREEPVAQSARIRKT